MRCPEWSDDTGSCSPDRHNSMPTLANPKIRQELPEFPQVQHAVVVRVQRIVFKAQAFSFGMNTAFRLVRRPGRMPVPVIAKGLTHRTPDGGRATFNEGVRSSHGPTLGGGSYEFRFADLDARPG